jgi:hypothetical protein
MNAVMGDGKNNGIQYGGFRVAMPWISWLLFSRRFSNLMQVLLHGSLSIETDSLESITQVGKCILRFYILPKYNEGFQLRR